MPRGVSEGCADCAIAVVEGAVDIEDDGELAVDFEGGVVDEGRRGRKGGGAGS